MATVHQRHGRTTNCGST